jgi:hypothetical protein
MNRPQRFRGLATDPGVQRKAPKAVFWRTGSRLEEQSEFCQSLPPVESDRISDGFLLFQDRHLALQVLSKPQTALESHERSKTMDIYEVYKGVTIKKSLNVFCASFPDGSWFGWSSLYDVKQKIDSWELGFLTLSVVRRTQRPDISLGKLV